MLRFFEFGICAGTVRHRVFFAKRLDEKRANYDTRLTEGRRDTGILRRPSRGQLRDVGNWNGRAGEKKYRPFQKLPPSFGSLNCRAATR